MNPDSPQQPAREALALVQGHMEAVRQLLSRMRPEELSLVQARYPQLPQLLGIPAELGGAAAAATDPREVDARPQTHNEGDGAFPTADDEAAAGSGVFGVGDQEEQGTPPGTPRESSPTAPPAPVRKPQPRTGPPRVPEEGSGLGKRPSDTRPSSEATPSGKAAAVAHESDAERIAGTAVAPGNPVESAGGVVRDDTATPPGEAPPHGGAPPVPPPAPQAQAPPPAAPAPVAPSQPFSRRPLMSCTKSDVRRLVSEYANADRVGVWRRVHKDSLCHLPAHDTPETRLSFLRETKFQYKDGVTDLTAAAYLGDEAVVRLILTQAVATSTPFTPEQGAEALVVAAQGNCCKIVELLVSNGIDPSASLSTGATPLLVAAEKGYFAIVRALLDAGANSNVADAMGWTAAHYAAQNGHRKVLDLLLAAGAVPNARARPDSCTPAHIAAQQNHAECLDALAANGADLNATYAAHASTPLHVAAYCGATAAARALVAGGAQLLILDGFQHSAFDVAAALGRAEILKALLEVNPPAATASTALGATLLHLAAYFRQGDAVAVLLRAGADVNALYQGAMRCPNQPLTTALEKARDD